MVKRGVRSNSASRQPVDGRASSPSATTCRPSSRRMMAAASRSRRERNLDVRYAFSAWRKISVISASKSSSASSRPAASSVWNRAARVAVRRGSCNGAKLAGFAARALRASRPSGAAGTSADGARLRPWPRMASMRSKCRSNSVGDRRLGAVRSSSNVTDGTPSTETNAWSLRRCSSVKAWVRRRRSRKVARWRTRSISEVARTFNVHPATIHRCLNKHQPSEEAL